MSEHRGTPNYVGAGIIVALMLGAAVAGVYIVTEILQDTGIIRLVATTVVGVMVLLSFLIAGAFVYRALNLSNANEALGLPRGTVRAVIALTLILIFVIMSLALVTVLEDEYISRGLTQTQLDLLLEAPGANVVQIIRSEDEQGQSIFGAIVVRESEAKGDFALQTLTTVSTLVVAVAGFYFGTRAIATARTGVVYQYPQINDFYIKPTRGKTAALEIQEFVVTGANFRADPSLQLVKVQQLQPDKRIPATDIILKGRSEIECKFDLSKNASSGEEWYLEVIFEDGTKLRAKDPITIGSPDDG